MRSFITPFRWRRLISQKIQATKAIIPSNQKLHARFLSTRQQLIQVSLAGTAAILGFALPSTLTDTTEGFWDKHKLVTAARLTVLFQLAHGWKIPAIMHGQQQGRIFTIHTIWSGRYIDRFSSPPEFWGISDIRYFFHKLDLFQKCSTTFYYQRFESTIVAIYRHLNWRPKICLGEL